MLKVVMAVSADDYVAKGLYDDMSWTGRDDKQAFRLLTAVGGVCGVGRTTSLSMPDHLHGRTLHVLSRRPYLVNGFPVDTMTLGQFDFRYPGAWLIGGQTIVMEALRSDLVSEVHLCRSPAAIGGGCANPVPDEVSPFVMRRGEIQNPGVPWRKALSSRVGEVVVDCYRRLDV